MSMRTKVLKYSMIVVSALLLGYFDFSSADEVVL